MFVLDVLYNSYKNKFSIFLIFVILKLMILDKYGSVFAELSSDSRKTYDLNLHVVKTMKACNKACTFLLSYCYYRLGLGWFKERMV